MSLLLIEPPSALQQIGKTMGLSEIPALRPFGIAARLARADCGGDDLLFREGIQNEAMRCSLLLKNYLSTSFVSISASQKRDAKQHHGMGNSYAGQEKSIKSIGEISLAEWKQGGRAPMIQKNENLQKTEPEKEAALPASLMRAGCRA